MTEVKIQTKSNLFVGIGVILLIFAGFFYFKGKKTEKAVLTPFEEIIVQEEGPVKKKGEEIKTMTDEEIQQMKEEVDGVLSVGGETAVLKDISGGSLSGKAERAFSDGKFYFRLSALGLKLAEKGYYYESWLKKEDEHFSTGRIEVDFNEKGILYYTTSINKLDCNQAVITLEPEDGNPEPAEKILEGKFQ